MLPESNRSAPQARPARERLRVLFITSNSHLRSTTSTLHAVFTELRPLGLEPVLVFREPGPWQAELAQTGIPCYFSPLDVPDRRNPLALGRQVLSLARIVVQERIDVIHVNEHDHYPLLRLVSRLTRRPTVVTAHFDIDRGFAEWAFRAPYTPDCLLFVSKALRAACDEAMAGVMAPERLHVHWNALAIDEFLQRGGSHQPLRDSWPVTDQTVVIGTASVIRPRKRLEHFVELVSRLRNSGRDVIGVIAGGGRFGDESYRQATLNLIAERGLTKTCLMVGNMDPVSPFLRAIDIFISTSLQEGLPMSLCEVQACGKPAVVYEAGGINEAIADPWCLLPSGDLDALTEKVTTLVDDSDRRQRLGREAEQFVRRHFDADAAAARQVAYYAQILGRPILATAT